MRLTLHTAMLVAAIIATIAPARADDRADMERFMADYLERWNAHDASAITTRFYRLEGNHPWSTEAGMRAEFDRRMLVVEGASPQDLATTITRELAVWAAVVDEYKLTAD